MRSLIHVLRARLAQHAAAPEQGGSTQGSKGRRAYVACARVCAVCVHARVPLPQARGPGEVGRDWRREIEARAELPQIGHSRGGPM